MSCQPYLPLSIVRPSAIVPAQPICSSAFRPRSASLALPTARPTLPSADFCNAVRSSYDSLSPEFETRRRTPGVSSVAFRAQLPDLRFASLMNMDFASRCPLVRRWRLISGFCPSARTFAPRFLQTPPCDGSPCASLSLHLRQVEKRTFTSKLLNMPGTQRSRFRGI